VTDSRQRKGPVAVGFAPTWVIGGRPTVPLSELMRP